MELYPGDTAPAKLSAEELNRLSPSERTELLGLLERREAERVEDTRPPVQHMILEIFFEDADKSDDPDAYLDQMLAHGRCRRKHLEEMSAATPPPSQDGPRPPLEELIVSSMVDLDEATRLAIADGFPPPTITAKQKPPAEPTASEVQSRAWRRATLPRDVQLDLEETDARRGERDFFNRIASRQDDDRLLPYRDKSSGSSAEPPNYPDN
jgi:hypothetical protein